MAYIASGKIGDIPYMINRWRKETEGIEEVYIVFGSWTLSSPSLKKINRAVYFYAPFS